MVLKFSPFHERQGADPTSGSARLRDSAACTLESETQPHLRNTIRSMLYVESGHGPAAQETLASHQDSNTTDRGTERRGQNVGCHPRLDLGGSKIGRGPM